MQEDSNDELSIYSEDSEEESKEANFRTDQHGRNQSEDCSP